MAEALMIRNLSRLERGRYVLSTKKNLKKIPLVPPEKKWFNFEVPVSTAAPLWNRHVVPCLDTFFFANKNIWTATLTQSNSSCEACTLLESGFSTHFLSKVRVSTKCNFLRKISHNERLHNFEDRFLLKTLQAAPITGRLGCQFSTLYVVETRAHRFSFNRR